MGIILRAKCKCGYEQKLFVDRGQVSKSILAPALCHNCGKIQNTEYKTEKPICNDCKTEMIFYNDGSLQKKQNAKSKISWGDSPLIFELKQTNYLCPKCKEFKLSFKKIGFWD